MASSDNPEAGLPHSQPQPPSTDPQPADQQSKKRSKQQLSCAGKFPPLQSFRMPIHTDGILCRVQEVKTKV